LIQHYLEKLSSPVVLQTKIIPTAAKYISCFFIADMGPKKAKNDDETKEKTSTAMEKSSTCPMDVVFYVIALTLVCFYGFYLHDKTAFNAYAEDYSVLKPFSIFFETVEQYSPFMEFLEDDKWAAETSDSGFKNQDQKSKKKF
jgi:hypothetical protein